MNDITIYQPYDVRDLIAEKKPAGLENLNEWDIPAEVRADIVNMTRSVITGGKNYLANKIPFASSFGINVNTHITFKMDAPMAVNVAMGKTALTPRLNLFVNPIWLLYKQGMFSEPFIDGESFEDVACILLHEYNHLLYDHHSKYDFYMKKGLGKVVNIATDCQINQDDMIARCDNLTKYGITLDAVKKITGNQSLSAKESSIYYFEEVMNKRDELAEPQGGGSGQGQGQGSQGQDQGQDGSGDPMGQGSQGQDQGQDGSGDPMGQEASHNVWNQTPEDCKENAGEDIASADAAEQALADAVKNAADVSGESIDSLKSRGLVAGNILGRIISGGGEPGKLPIKSVLLKGAGRLKMGERKTYRKINPHQGNRVDIRRGKVQENGKNIRTFIDNSGSMSAWEINWAMNEIAAVAKKARANLEVIPFDTKVYSENKQYANKNGKWTFRSAGHGGTAFQPVFDYLHNHTKANNRDDLIIVITDGYGEYSVDTYGLNNVIWLLVEEKRNTLSISNPVGQVAWLDQDNKYRLHKLQR